MANVNVELVGTIKAIRFRDADSGFTVGLLADGTPVVGECRDDPPLVGVEYRFIGRWKDDAKWGRQFRFAGMVQQAPNSRTGVVAYLKKYAPNVGPVIANRLVDLYGPDGAIGILKADPERVAREVRGITAERAHEAADALVLGERFQETLVRLLDLFDGRGFPNVLLETCIKVFGVKAPERIRRDPWSLLVRSMPGCGFLRVDRLYLELGHPPDRMKRQVMAFQHVLASDMSGTVWHHLPSVERQVGALVTGNYRPERAVAIGVRAGLFAIEHRSGSAWLADRNNAAAEREVARFVVEGFGGRDRWAISDAEEEEVEHVA